MQPTRLIPSAHATRHVARARVGALASVLLLSATLLSLAPTAHADDLGTLLGGGAGAAAGAVLGQSVGGKNGSILGGAIGGATGAAVSTRGSGQGGAVIGGAVGGAAGAAVGHSVGGSTGAILGAGAGGAAGASLGKSVSQRQGPYADGRGPRYEASYRKHGHREDRDHWRDDRGHDRGHHYGRDARRGRDYAYSRDEGRD